MSLSASRCCLSTSASRCLTSVSCRVRHFNRRPHLQRASLPSLMLLKLPGRGSVGTCPRCRWGTAHCWIRPAARSASAGWPRCKWPRPPASPPSSARSWSSGTPSRTPGRGCSSRSNTGGKRQALREHCRVKRYNFFFFPSSYMRKNKRCQRHVGEVGRESLRTDLQYTIKTELFLECLKSDRNKLSCEWKLRFIKSPPPSPKKSCQRLWNPRDWNDACVL